MKTFQIFLIMMTMFLSFVVIMTIDDLFNGVFCWYCILALAVFIVLDCIFISKEDLDDLMSKFGLL